MKNEPVPLTDGGEEMTYTILELKAMLDAYGKNDWEDERAIGLFSDAPDIARQLIAKMEENERLTADTDFAIRRRGIEGLAHIEVHNKQKQRIADLERQLEEAKALFDPAPVDLIEAIKEQQQESGHRWTQHKVDMEQLAAKDALIRDLEQKLKERY